MTALPIPLASPAPLVWVLVPIVETDDPNLAWYSDYSNAREEYARAFAALGLAWKWQPVTMQDYRTVVAGIRRASRGFAPIVLNLCDGDEINGSPGLSVIHALREANLPFTGADERFYDLTTSKIVMKRLFEAAGVPTAPWAVVARDGKGSAALFRALGATLILKPAISAGSLGIGMKSVVRSPQALRAQLKRLHDGYRGWGLTEGGAFVERFIIGPEYTTFIVGSHDDPAGKTVYPPVERRFNATIPVRERFLSFDRLWGIYEDEPEIDGGDGELWQYKPVRKKALAREIEAVSWAAYAAVGGRGYGRVDLRQDARTGKLYVLEVNSQCGLSEDPVQTSIGAILIFAKRSFASAVEAILAAANPAERRRGRRVVRMAR
jgi:D-alanine-D-alanine ligase